MKHHLQKHKTAATKYTCPGCGHTKRFTRYVYADSGEQIADHVGRCDRQESCQYHFTPRMYFGSVSDAIPARDARYSQINTPPNVKRDGIVSSDSFREQYRARVQGVSQPCSERIAPTVAAPPVRTSYIPLREMQRSMMHYRDNNFVQYLYTLGTERSLVHRCILDYRIGTSAHWHGATVLWQIDAEQRIRTGKVMLYDRETGRRVREPFSHITWMHTLMGLEGYHLRQCLYGEHLLQKAASDAIIAITESEKTAMIASILMPEMVWMAAGGKEQLSLDKMTPLRGRRVILYPDQGGYELWSRRAEEMSGIVRVSVTDLLEGQEKGVDLADVMMGSFRF